jgi:hypothetical protein
MNVEILERTDTFTIGIFRRVLLLVWSGRNSALGVERSHAHFRQLKGQAGVILSVVAPRPTGPPEDDTRAALDRVRNHPVPGLLGVATLYEGSGFVAAAIRAIVTRIRQPGQGGATRFFRSGEEAASWAAELLRQPELTGQALANAIREVREA